jgi:hypothetical protein
MSIKLVIIDGCIPYITITGTFTGVLRVRRGTIKIHVTVPLPVMHELETGGKGGGHVSWKYPDLVSYFFAKVNTQVYRLRCPDGVFSRRRMSIVSEAARNEDRILEMTLSIESIPA